MDISQLLTNLLSSDSSTLKAAEQQLKQLQDKSPQELVVALIQVFKTQSISPEAIKLSTILLRRVLGTDFVNLSPDFQTSVKQELLATLQQCNDQQLQKLICQVISNIPPAYLCEWKEIVPWTLQQAQSNGNLTHSAVYLLGLLAEFAWDNVNAHLKAVVDTLGVYLGHTNDNLLQLCALDTFSLLLLSTKTPRDFQPLVESSISVMLAAIETGLATGNVYQACESFENFTNIVKKCFWALDRELEQHLGKILAIVGNSAYDSDGRALALETLVIITDKRSKVVVQNGGLMETLVKCLMHSQCVDEEWEAEWDPQGQPLAEDLFEVGQKGLRGSSISVLVTVAEQCNQNILPHVFTLLPPMLSSQDWKLRYAALCTVAVLVESQGKFMEPHLEELTQFIHPSLSDSNARVRYAGLACLNELLLCEALAGELHEKAGAAIVSTLASSALGSDSNTCPMVQSCACIALSSFCNPAYCSADMLAPHLDNVVGALVRCLQNAPLSVQEYAMVALQQVAMVAQAEFGRFYDHIVPGIKNVISSSGSESSALRAAAMSCIAAVAEAVGVERFSNDGQEVMRVLLVRENVDEFELEGLLDFSRRVSVVMKEAFLPYMPHVMPIVFKSCSMEKEFDIEKMDDVVKGTDDVVHVENGMLTQVQKVHGVGNMKISANVYGMQIRRLALSAIDEMADALGAAFLPYLTDSLAVVLPCLSARLDVESAIKASDASASLVYCMWKSIELTGEGVQHGLQVLTTVMTAMLMGLETSNGARNFIDDCDWRSGFAGGLERCLRICWESYEEDCDKAVLFPPLQLQPQWTKVYVESLKQSVQRRMTKSSELAREGYDEEDLLEVLEELNEMERDFSEMIVDCIGYTLKLHRVGFLPVFDSTVLPFITQLLNSKQPAELRHNAICLFDDAIEFCSPESHKYLDTCLPAMMQYMSDDDPKLRQAAVYGIGQVAVHAAVPFRRIAPEVANTLVALISANNARSEEFACATENAVSALGKICRLHGDGFPAEMKRWAPFWVSQLPLTVDEDEAKHCHQLLCEFVAEDNVNVMGDGYANVPSVVKAFSGILVGGACGGSDDAIEIANQTTLDVVPELIKKLQNNVPAGVLTEAWNGLTEAERAAVQEVQQ